MSAWRRAARSAYDFFSSLLLILKIVYEINVSAALSKIAEFRANQIYAIPSHLERLLHVACAQNTWRTVTTVTNLRDKSAEIWI
jgi:hypothetical protein